MDVLDKLQSRYRELDRDVVNSVDRATKRADWNDVGGGYEVEAAADRDLLEIAMNEIRMLRVRISLLKSICAEGRYLV